MALQLCRNVSRLSSALNLLSAMKMNRHKSVVIRPITKSWIRKDYQFFHSSAGLHHGEYERLPPKSEEDVVNIRVVDRDDIEYSIRGKVGDNVMILAQNHDVDIEGACEASLACCTCHVYVEDPYFDRLDEADVKEEDLLDMAPFLAENSRLSCQILLRKDLDGMLVRLPVGTRNMRVDTKGQQQEQQDGDTR